MVQYGRKYELHRTRKLTGSERVQKTYSSSLWSDCTEIAQSNSCSLVVDVYAMRPNGRVIGVAQANDIDLFFVPVGHQQVPTDGLSHIQRPESSRAIRICTTTMAWRLWDHRLRDKYRDPGDVLGAYPGRQWKEGIEYHSTKKFLAETNSSKPYVWKRSGFKWYQLHFQWQFMNFDELERGIRFMK
jgi:hypothetical protein